MLDTNACISLINGTEVAVRRRFRRALGKNGEATDYSERREPAREPRTLPRERAEQELRAVRIADRADIPTVDNKQ